MIRMNDPAFHHRRFAGAQAALAVLKVDERQDTSVLFGRFFQFAFAVVFHHRLDQVGNKGARHGARSAGIEVRHQGNGFLAVEGTLDGVAAGFDKRAQLVRRHRGFNFEIANLFDFRR